MNNILLHIDHCLSGCHKVQLGNWSKGLCNAYLHSIGLNKAIIKTVYDTRYQKAVCANDDIKCPIPQLWKSDVSLNIFIDALIHLLFLGLGLDITLWMKHEVP